VTKNPDGTEKVVHWSDWVKNTLLKARKNWLAGDHGPDALDPDLLDDDGDADIREWTTHASIDDWNSSVPELQLDPWEGQPRRVIVLCEKAGMRGVVESACYPTSTNYMCCGGDASMKQKSNVGKWAAKVKDAGLEPIVLYAGDHDMQGVNMDKTWVRDVAEIDSVTRVAITLEQARERGLPMENAYDKMHRGADVSGSKKSQNTKIQDYVDEHGPEMVELNALVVVDEVALRNIIRDAIREHVDEDVWKERAEDIKGPAERAHKLVQEMIETLEGEYPELA
jgi:hypothetical protein